MGREFEEQAEHDQLVRLLHRKFYRFPSAERPNYQTFTNHPMKTRSVRTADGTECFPDIVVFWPRHDRPVTVVEVETASTITEEEAEEWRTFSRLSGDFHLYVPRGQAARAMQLCRGSEPAELHEFWTRDGKHYQKRWL